MSQPQKGHDNISNPKQYENNYQQLKRQKDSQNLQNYPPEPPKITPRKTKRKTNKEAKTQSKKAYAVEHSPSKEQQECHNISGTSKMNATLPSVEESQLNVQNYDHDVSRNTERNKDDTKVAISAEGEVILDNLKAIHKDTESPLSVNNKELVAGRYMSVGVQVSPLPQYRLRFLPISSCTAYDSSESQHNGVERIRFCLQLVGRWMLSQCGLGVIIFVWALLGAAAFRATEGPYEEHTARELLGRQHELVIELARDLRILKQEEPGWHNRIEYYVDKHKEMLLEAVSEGYGEGGSKGKIWSYPGCLLFAVSLLTTLGKTQLNISSRLLLDVNIYRIVTFALQNSNINLLKMKHISFIYGLSAYHAVNTLHFSYKNQSLNVL
jgi:hypothetical protein